VNEGGFFKEDRILDKLLASEKKDDYKNYQNDKHWTHVCRSTLYCTFYTVAKSVHMDTGIAEN
jgi:hypothetical protein